MVKVLNSSPWPAQHSQPQTPASSIRVSEIISALSYALDLTEGRPMGHSVRACMIGMKLADQIGLSESERGDLYYALVMKDAGCSSNSSRLFHILNADDLRAKGDLKTKDWTRVGWESLQYALTHVATGMPFLQRMHRLLQVAATQQQDSCILVKIRCERGAYIAERLGFSASVSTAIRALDEHWDGRGYPDGQRKADIPLFSRIANLAQTLEVFYSAHGPEAAIAAAKDRSGRWFDPELVQAAVSLAARGDLWSGLDSENIIQAALTLEPEQRRMTANEETIDNICHAFAEIIDAKSPFTYRHSNGVADAAMDIGQAFGMSSRDLRLLRRAALLHDIGKLSVSNTILESPGKLTDSEWKIVKDHPYFTFQILKRIPGFEELASEAAAHHEKLDGSGYWQGWNGEQMSSFARILVVADIFDALRAKRPYRDSLPLERVFEIMRADAPHALDLPSLEALIAAKSNSAPLTFGQPVQVAVSEKV